MINVNMNKRAFLLLEIMVVLVILGILLGAMLPLLDKQIFKFPQSPQSLLNVSFCNNISPQCLLNPSLETPLPFIELSITPSAP